MALFVIISFVLGLIIGSFANVFVLRWGTGRSLSGRSGCPACGHRLAWRELVPVVSFFVQRGRCRACETRISPHYVLVELLFGALFAFAAYAAFTPPVATASYIDAAFSFVVIFLLVSIAVYDFKHFIIPDGMVYAYLVVSFLWGSAAGGFALAGIGMTLVSGVVVAFPLFFLWAVSKGRWMGFGDVKLAAGLGMMLGILGGGSALIFAVWLGALVSLAIIAYGHVRTRMRMRFATRKARFTMKSEIPFGPFLVAGTLFVFLTDITLTRLIELL